MCGSCIDSGLACVYASDVKRDSNIQPAVRERRRAQKIEQRSPTASAISSPGSSCHDFRMRSEPRSLKREDSANESPDSAICMNYDSMSYFNASDCQLSCDRDVLESIHAGLELDPSQCGDASEYRGGSSGIEVTRRIRSLCNLLIGPQDKQTSSYDLLNAFDRSFPRHLLQMYAINNVHLPPKPETIRLLGIAITKVLRFWPFINRAFIRSKVEQLYDAESSCRVNPDDRGLIYALLALGQRYDSGLRPTASDTFVIGSSNGLAFFSVAQQLIRLPNGPRTLSSIQTTMCLALYLVSASAKKLAQCYISLASYEAYHLGLHRAPTSSSLGSKLATHIWTYISLRDLDVYIKASLGLPCIVHSAEISLGPIHAPEHGTEEELTAANARTHLFEILTQTLKSYHMEEDSLSPAGTYSMPYERIRDFEEKLETWEHIHARVLQESDDTTELSLQYYRCWAELTIYSPFMHYILQFQADEATPAFRTVNKCLRAASRTVETAKVLFHEGDLDEPNPITAEALAMAAVVLLAAELSGPAGAPFQQVHQASKGAYSLLRATAKQNGSALTDCLKSLEPLYQVTRRSIRA